MAETIFLKPGLPALPADLMLARDHGEVLFIVGAGVSYPDPSSLPDFGGLVAQIYAEVDPTMSEPIDRIRAGGEQWADIETILTDLQRTELKFFQQNEFDVVLGMLERRIDDDPTKDGRMRAAAEKVLSKARAHNALHSALVTLGQRFGEALLVTTNFDRLLEAAAKAARIPFSASALGQMPNPSRASEFSGIMHIHGMLPHHRQPGSQLILTDRDFGDHYLRRHTVTSFLYDAARIFSLVLVGYSANDSPVRYLLNAIASDERHFVDLKPRYAFVGCDPNDTRTPAEWTARGIIPIAYNRADGHRALGEVLTEWSRVIPSDQNKKPNRARLKEISKLSPGAPEAEVAKSLLWYLVRRSNPSERIELIETLSKFGADPLWLTFVNGVIRRPEEGPP
ncbi:SIR2 family protein [Devosia sp.]|uniref:SIR2 family protein n=1 Tax=Devosia sp. TaxID=1871048 RepID=UPI0019F08EC9|nr:SIR2 family protein [Devosia sp.]MBE0581885.1 SIR2 family protein [Devosia sp.]